MLAATPTRMQWLETFQSLMHYCLPSVQRSSSGVGICVVLLIGGLIVAFRSARVARWLVALAGVLVGAIVGVQLALKLGGPSAVCGAAGAAVVGLVAWRTHKLWLAAGSVVALSSLVTSYQLLAAGEFPKLLEDMNRRAAGEKPVVKLVSPAEQLANLHPDTEQRLERLWNGVTTTMKSWGITGWLIPAVGLVVGVALAIWALQMFAVIWLALLGAVAAVSGASGLLFMFAPETQQAFVREPHWPLSIVAGIWVLGMVWQAKNARFGAKPAAKGKPAAAAA